MSGHAPPYQQQFGGQQPPFEQQQQQYNQTQYDSQGVPQPGQHPAYQQPQQLVLSPEERAVMKECTDESFWYRSLPLSVAQGAVAHVLVEKEILKPSLRYGSKPKVALAVFVGYFIGKFSYADICADKFINKAPRSKIADAIRTRRGLPPLEPTETETNGPDYGGLGVPQQDTTPIQYGYQSELEVAGGLPQQPSASNYDDLRRKNRELSQAQDGYRSSQAVQGDGVYDDLRRMNRGINQAPVSQPNSPPAPLQPQYGGGQPIAPPPPRPLYRPPGQGESKYGDDGFE